MNLSITSRPPYAPPVEFVERKGLGHPDTICDRLAEDLGNHLARLYIERTGRVQPFNVDKAVLAAGSVEVSYGGGRIVKPSRLVMVGKADFSHGFEPDVDDLTIRLRRRLHDLLPDASEDAFTVEIWLNPSSSDLAEVVKAADVIPLANDTSFAAVSIPRSPLEEVVHEVESRLNDAEYRERVPVGRDIKVMGARTDGAVVVTVASPIMATRVQDPSAYREAVDQVRRDVREIVVAEFGDQSVVRVNQADLEHSPYLTLSGTSAEAGDDGQVGRGNRFGGLITPYRPMSLEAAAGKNPYAHVGKTYHAIGFDMANRIIGETSATETTVRLLSSIGHPVTEPQAVHVEVVGGPDPAEIAMIAKESFADWAGVRDRLIAGRYELF